MNITIFETKEALGAAAAREAGAALRKAIDDHGEARAIAATGASQFTFLEALQREPGIAWDRVTFFHLDEYVGLPDTHPASFRRYLRERIIEPLRPRHFELVNGNAEDPAAECLRLERVLRERPIDVAFVGIGENGHLAFNDPPADLTTGARISSCRSMRRAGVSRWARDGSRRSPTCRQRPSPCRSRRSSARANCS
jgi:glucosamine-6-phosphate deaminase